MLLNGRGMSRPWLGHSQQRSKLFERPFRAHEQGWKCGIKSLEKGIPIQSALVHLSWPAREVFPNADSWKAIFDDPECGPKPLRNLGIVVL